MSNQSRRSHGVMEGDGAYNKHARLQADGIVLAADVLKKAISEVELDYEGPIVIADYGSSQGKNSLLPLQAAVTGLRKRVGPDRAIFVFHIDQPSNDFNSLFQVLTSDASSYVVNHPGVYSAAIGRSFYENVLPRASVHLGWSSYAAMWLSRVPALIPGHFIPICSRGAVREVFDRQAAQDWEAFLSLRAEELRPGGRMVIVLPGVADDNSVGLEPLFDQVNEVLGEMVGDGAITSDERARMAIMSHPRNQSDLLIPFAQGGRYQGLNVEGCTRHQQSDAAWAQYERDGDKEALAAKRSLFFRSAFLPSLACALDPVPTHSRDAIGMFGNELERRITERLRSRAFPMRTFVQTILLAKAH